MDTLTRISPVSAALDRRASFYHHDTLIEDLVYLNGFTGSQETRAYYEVDERGYLVGVDYLTVSIPDFGVHFRLTQTDVKPDVWLRIEDSVKDETDGR